MLHRSVRHAPPNLTTTIKVLCDGLKKNQAHSFDPLRQVAKLLHHLQEGEWQIQTEKGNDTGIGMELGDEGESGAIVEMDDLEI
jgi:hypothetical protein